MSYNIKNAWKVEKIYQKITKQLKDDHICGQQLIMRRKAQMKDAMENKMFSEIEYGSWFKSYKIT